jgi:PAS domain S-box-containing protein
MILVVGGDHAECDALGAALAGEGYTLSFAGGVPEALALARIRLPDLFLLCSDLDIVETSHQLHSEPFVNQVPILATAARDEEALRLQALETGADDFIAWPPSLAELRARVRALVRLSHTRQQLREQERQRLVEERRWEEQRRQLGEEIGRRNRELLALQSAGAAITSSLDLAVVLDTVTREMAHLLGMKACAISQWSPEAHTLRVLARYDPQDWWASEPATTEVLPVSLASTEQVLLDQQVWQITVGQPGVDPAELASMQRLGIETALKVPMVFADQVMGLVEVADDCAERLLTPDEIALAHILANQAASAIENARLYDAIRRHVAEVTTLNRISQVITSSLNLQETLSIIADHAMWLLDVAAASVNLYDRQSNYLWFGAASGEGADFIRGKRLELGHGIVNWVIQNGEPLMVQDAAKDPRWYAEWDRQSGFTTRSILCVPLRSKGRTIGAIEAINKTSGPFDREDLSLLTSMAASAAIAIENARLYEQAQNEIIERRRAESRLRQVNRALRTLGECHEALVRAEEEHELLRDVCRILVEVGGHRLAWVGLAAKDAAASARPLTSAGHGSGYLDLVGSTWAEMESGHGPASTAVRTQAPCIVRNIRAASDFPRQAKAIQHGCVSAIALPLIASERTLGVLSIYAGEPDAFDAEEIDLLKELARNLAFGIVALHTRAERDRAEEEIRHLYQELQDHANRLEETVAERTRELQAERDRTQAILEAVGEAVIVTDLEGAIQYVNPAAVVLTGYTVEEAVGRSPRMWLQDQEAVGSYHSADVLAMQAQRTDVVSRRKDGKLYDAAMTVAPLFDSHEPDRLVGHVCVQRDITPIKEAERLKDQFVSNVSHELRTPLSVITLLSGNLDRLYDRLGDEKRRKMIRDIRDQGQVLNELVGDVLEISRIESGHVSMERQRVDLAQLASEETDKQLPLARKKALALHMTTVPNVAVWGNPDQLRQVIRNLLNNAIKFTPNKGQIRCECLASASQELIPADWPGSASLPAGRWAALRVVDTGVGITAEELPHLYERFYRAKTQGNIPGTGLGLSIAQELIELHDGKIAATSTPGKGSIFAIYVPLLEE